MLGVGSGEVSSVAPTVMPSNGYEGLERERERERAKIERENFDFAILALRH